MTFKLRIRDVIGMVLAANLAQIALLKGTTNMSYANMKLMAYTKYQSIFVHPRIPVNVHLAEPLAIPSLSSGLGTRGVVVPGYNHIEGGQGDVMGMLKYFETSSYLDYTQVDFDSSSPPKFLESDSTFQFPIERNIVPIKMSAVKSNADGDDKLSSFVVLWSDSSVTFHSITGTTITLRWKVNISNSYEFLGTIDLEEVAISFIRNKALQNGMVIVGASFVIPEHDNLASSPTGSKHHFSYFALDAQNGKELWHHLPNSSEDSNAGKRTKLERTSSMSGLHYYQRYKNDVVFFVGDDTAEDSVNCLHHFRVSSLEALPHFWTNFKDTKFTFAHFERHKRGQTKLKRKHHRFPNVAVAHNSKGIEVVSLSSGKPVCHLSLIDGIYYDDIQNDGRLEHIQLVKEDTEGLPSSIQWTPDLTESFNANKHEDKIVGTEMPLCEVLAMSGIPAREKVYSRPLCKIQSKFIFQTKRVAQESLSQVDFAPPLAVGETNMIFAVNSGIVSKVSHDGSFQYQVSDMPTWNSHNASDFVSVSLLSSDRIESDEDKPLVVSGENEVAIISPHGRKLGQLAFPQHPIHRPTFTDINMDGTDDVMMSSTDGVWFYTIQFGGGSNIVIIINSFIFMFMMVSLLINHTNSYDKRSTDILE